MVSKNDFSREDWIRVATAPIVAAAVISAADDVDKGRTSEEEELAAFDEILQTLAKAYKKIDLIPEVIAALAEKHQLGATGMDAVFGFSIHQTDDLDQKLTEVAAAVTLVEQAGDRKDAKAYKQFILEASETVSIASKESFGLFAGRTSQKESVYLRKLRKIMGM